MDVVWYVQICHLPQTPSKQNEKLIERDVICKTILTVETSFMRCILYIIFPKVCLYALTLYPATDGAAVTDVSGVSGRWQLSR